MIIEKLKEWRRGRKWERLSRKYSDALLKATCDEFNYACGLRSGGIIKFCSATIHGEWVLLKGPLYSKMETTLCYPFDRGIDVRLSDISWVADAPEGS